MPRTPSVKPVHLENENEPMSESYISIGLGVLVVVVVGILLYNYFTSRGKTTPNPAEEKLTQEATMAAKPGSTYTVAEGDTLWSISEKSYGTGYNWTDIAKANNLENSDQLEAGQKIVIPEVSPTTAALATPEASPLAQEVEPSPSPVTQVAPETVPPTTPTITGNSYTVVEGDTLWDIACRAYGDCYAWSKIAEANKLENPDLIHPGNVFTLPR